MDDIQGSCHLEVIVCQHIPADGFQDTASGDGWLPFSDELPQINIAWKVHADRVVCQWDNDDIVCATVAGIIADDKVWAPPVLVAAAVVGL